MEFVRMKGPESPWYAPAMALYRASFPLHEQRTGQDQRRAMEDPAFHCDAIVEGGAFLGLIFYWRTGRACYVEHFAMEPALRGRSLGSQALRTFCPSHAPVLLEIDPPVDDISIRRRSFYGRLGFQENPWPHRHPPYRTGFPPHPLVVMTWPEGFDEGAYRAFSAYLGDTVMAYAEP